MLFYFSSQVSYNDYIIELNQRLSKRIYYSEHLYQCCEHSELVLVVQIEDNQETIHHLMYLTREENDKEIQFALTLSKNLSIEKVRKIKFKVYNIRRVPFNTGWNEHWFELLSVQDFKNLQEKDWYQNENNVTLDIIISVSEKDNTDVIMKLSCFLHPNFSHFDNFLVWV